MTAAERARRYRTQHADRIKQARRLRRLAPPLLAGQQRIRITQIDGTLPNLALMKLAAFHRAHGDAISFSRSPYRSPVEPNYDRVYGSAIFSFSKQRVERFRAEFPGAIVGGVRSLSSAAWSTSNRLAGRCRSIACSTISRSWFGSMASSSTDAAPKPLARLSVCLVGRVGRFQAAIWSGFTAMRSKVATIVLSIRMTVVLRNDRL
jgi:hypothetical protein